MAEGLGRVAVSDERGGERPAGPLTRPYGFWSVPEPSTARTDRTEVVRRSRLMRETRTCAPPGHLWRGPVSLGALCLCGETGWDGPVLDGACCCCGREGCDGRGPL